MSIVKLNIVMTYPVKWSEYTIINNYVQNFYDALGREHFIEGFRYGLEEGVLTMQADKGFAKEWLFFMGASTKRSSRQCAGGFGEGFKIASLTAYRDLHLSIRMESRDWTLTVTEVTDKIDQKEVSFLAYDIGERPYEENTILILENASEKLLKETESQVNHFFYRENPKLGACIWNRDGYAVYKTKERENEKKNCGGLFAGYQYRGSFGAPLVICNHKYCPNEDDRDRDFFRRKQMQENVELVMWALDEESSWRVLEILKPYWFRTQEKGWSGLDWKQSLRILLINISWDDSVLAKFQDKYRDKLVADDDISTDRNTRKIAKKWFRQSEFREKRRVVDSFFSQAGIQTITELCRENHGFTVDAEPDRKEQQYIAILEKAARKILSDILCMEEFPSCRIMLNREAAVAGYTKMQPDTAKKKNAYGLKVIRRAKHVYLKKVYFRKDSFGSAFAVYAHELLHQFGGDCSMQFRKALLLMDISIAEHGETVKKLEKEWRDIV